MTSKFAALTNTDPDFYPVMGPFLSRREVVAAVGGPIWDEDGKTWIVARTRGGVDGFCAFTARGRAWWVESLYTVTGDQALAARRVSEAVARFGPGRPQLQATVRQPHVPAYTAAGFTVVSQSANFTKLVWRLT
jgi:hypothetical protein